MEFWTVLLVFNLFMAAIQALRGRLAAALLLAVISIGCFTMIGATNSSDDLASYGYSLN